MESPWSRFLVQLVVLTAVMHTLLFGYSVGLEIRKRPLVIVIGGSRNSLEPRFGDAHKTLVGTTNENSELVYSTVGTTRTKELSVQRSAFLTAPGVITQWGAPCSRNDLSTNLMIRYSTDVSLTSNTSFASPLRADFEDSPR